MLGRGKETDGAVVERTDAFLRDLPNIHEEGRKQAHAGGLNLRLGRVMVQELLAAGRPPIIETGAGCSTLLFMMLGCESITSIAPEAVLHRRILEEAETRGLDATAFTYVEERSEIALPRLAIDEERSCGAAFIDGNHGWPSVFVDFCYLNMMMRQGSLLFVDDVHIYACAQLLLLLRSQPGFELVRLDGKMATFRKTTKARFLPDWRDEPFIAMNTSNVRLG